MLKTPLRKMEKSLAMQTVFLVLNLVCYLVLGLILFPVYAEPWMIYLNVSIEALMFAFWMAASCKNPGVIDRPKEIKFLDLMQLIDPV